MRHPKRTIKAVTRGVTQIVNKSLERYFISLVFKKMQNKVPVYIHQTGKK